MKRKGNFESLQTAKKVIITTARVQRKRGVGVNQEEPIAKRARVVVETPHVPHVPYLESEYTDPDQPSLLASLVDFFYSCTARGY